MNIEEFRATLQGSAPPNGLSRFLAALWWDAAGNFDRAHELADDESDGREAAWVHAYLHRKNGEPDNAAYWYKLARQPYPQIAHQEEWQQIVSELLNHQERK